MNHPLKAYIGIVIVTLLALVLIKQFNISYPLTIVNKTAPADLSVVGEGKVDVVPDMATVQVGVTANGSTVADVQSKIDGVNNKILSSTESLGIKKEDLKTSNYSINPTYDYTRGGSDITGYAGNVSISIKVRNQDILSQVVSAATAAGANQVYDTQFSVDKPEAYREQARDKAIANAKEQAQKLASSLGIKLGKVVNIVESSPSSPGPFYYSKSAPAALGGVEDASTNRIEPGTQTITSTVTLFFEVK